MNRSLQAVLLGTFALRFATGLTGAMITFYLAKLTPGGHPVDPIVVGVFSALFFTTELSLSPIFGVLSDRLGHHRVMLFGPVFGLVSVIIAALTSNLAILGGTRLLAGAATAASVPSILGYIALASAGDEDLRGKAAARFEGVTLAGLGVGLIAAPKLFDAMNASAFLLNALIYLAAFLIYGLWVEDAAGERERIASEHVDLRRYFDLIQSGHIWLLAPTWIAVNAAIGLWFSQSLFAFARRNDRFPGQLLARGFSANEITVAAIVIAIVFGAGLVYWGNRFKAYRRTTIILYGILGGAATATAGLVVNHSDGLPLLVPLAAGAVVLGGLFVLAGATPAALGLLADMSERFPADRGAIMGLYSVFLGVGQITGSLIGGGVAHWRGVDGLLLGTIALLAIALLPLARLRTQEHELDHAGPAQPSTA